MSRDTCKRTLCAVPDCLATTRALCSARVLPGFHRLPQAVRSSRSGGHADACCRLLLPSSSVCDAREHHTARLRALLFDRQPVGLCVRVSLWDWPGSGVGVLASLLGALYAGPDRVVANRTSTTANVAVTIESSPTIFHVLYWLRRTGRPLARRRCQALGYCIRASLGTRPRWVALLAWGLPALLLAPGGVPVFFGRHRMGSRSSYSRVPPCRLTRCLPIVRPTPTRAPSHRCLLIAGYSCVTKLPR